jgi:hypothetical protein
VIKNFDAPVWKPFLTPILQDFIRIVRFVTVLKWPVKVAAFLNGQQRVLGIRAPIVQQKRQHFRLVTQFRRSLFFGFSE